MAGFSIEWDGLTELGDVLAKAMRENESKVKTVIYNNGEKAKSKAIEWAPKPGGSRYGDNPYAEGPLHENIVHTHYGLASEIQAMMFYSGYVNFGTRYMRAQPFMTDTFNWIVKFLEQDIKDVAEGLFV